MRKFSSGEARTTVTRQFLLWEPHIHSFVDLCPSVINNVGDVGYEDHDDGLCSGISVGVKDIIDVAGLATRNGSKVYSHVEAATDDATDDATVVAALRSAGASIV